MMNWNYSERSGIYTINDAHFPFPPNFSGEERQFNDAGKRNFVVAIDEALYKELQEKGVRVRVRAPRNDEEDPLYLLTVKVYIPDGQNSRARSPEIWARSEGGHMRPLEGDMCCEIDVAWSKRRIEHADLEFHIGSSSKYPSNPPCAYLDSIVVTMSESLLVKRYQNADDSAPF